MHEKIKKLKIRLNMINVIYILNFSWMFFFTLLKFGYGIMVLWGKPWLWDIRYCWYGYPNHVLEADVWLYLITQLAFYWSKLFTMFSDVKRKGNLFIVYGVY